MQSLVLKPVFVLLLYFSFDLPQRYLGARNQT